MGEKETRTGQFPDRRPTAWACALALVLAGLGPTFAAHAKVVPVEGIIAAYGLKTDVPALLSYLSDGLPPTPAGEPKAGKDIPASLCLSRWDLYKYAVGLLHKKGAPEAAPVLMRLVNNPLPRPMLEDLAMYLALEPESPWSVGETTREGWDAAMTGQTASLRGDCALALGRIGGDEAVQAVLGLVQTLQPMVSEEIQKTSPDFWLLYGFCDGCTALTMLGRKEGIDALIKILPSTYGHWLYLDDYLRRNAGDPFELAPDMPKPAYDKAVRAWQDWWRANRETISLGACRDTHASQGREHRDLTLIDNYCIICT